MFDLDFSNGQKLFTYQEFINYSQVIRMLLTTELDQNNYFVLFPPFSYLHFMNLHAILTQDHASLL